jgi:DNA segregation ATPase FtsK/SpoIIIE, S-DNA-T family
MRRLSWAHVRAARFRRSAKGRADWLADDLAAASRRRRDQDLGDLPPLDRLPDVMEQDRTGGRPVLAVVPDPAEDGPRLAVDRDRDGPDDGPGPVVAAGPVPGRRSSVPDRPVREDQPPANGSSWTEQGGRPLAPGWMAHPVQAGRRVVSHQAHVAAFHGLRAPEYALRAARWAPRGVTRSLVGLCRWASDYEGRELRWDAAARGDAREYLHLSRQRNQRVHNRVPVAVGLVAVVVIAVAVAVAASPGSPATRFLVIAALVGVFGAVGAPADRPWIEHATVSPGARKITPDLLVQAFAAAKLCSLDGDRAPGPIRFLSPIAHDGPGVRAVIELPAGRTASEAIGRREQIAAGLDIDEFRVFLERVRGTSGSARRLVAWIADRDPYEARSPVTPLVAKRSWDFWSPFPYGVDARGRTVSISLVWSSLLIGSIPRMGKTNAARIPAAAAALDPYTRLVIADGKGGKDFEPLASCAHFYASGIRDVVVEAIVGVLREAVEDMNARFERMATLPDDICPEGKVTEAITRRPAYGMPLTVILIDEVQRYLEHPEHGKTILGLLTDLAKTGPAAGYILVVATQRPDTKTMPEDLRGQIGTRFALRTMNWQASETILGAGTYTAGLDSSKFLRTHLGVGILLGSDDTQVTDGEAVTVRTHLLGIAELRKIGQRGRQLRIEAGTLTGTAAGERVIDEAPQRRLLDDVLDVFEPGEDRVWSETLCARLAARAPGTYDGWDPTTLANALRAFGVDTAQVWGRTAAGEGANRRGVARQAVLDAIAERGNTGPKAAKSAAGAGIEALAERLALAPGPARSSTPDSRPDQGPSA